MAKDDKTKEAQGSNPPAVVPQPVVAQQPAADPPRTFTQDEVNQMVGRVRKEVRDQFADYDAIKAKMTELETASMTEAERKDKALAEAQKKAADADTYIAATSIDTAVRLAAVKAGLVDEDAALALIDRNAVKFDPVSRKVSGVDEALKALVEQRPWLKADVQRRAPNLNPGGGPPSTAGVLSPEERRVAHSLLSHLKPEEAEAEYAKQKQAKAR